jgi:hypothetical protein
VDAAALGTREAETIRELEGERIGEHVLIVLTKDRKERGRVVRALKRDVGAEVEGVAVLRYRRVASAALVALVSGAYRELYVVSPRGKVNRCCAT